MYQSHYNWVSWLKFLSWIILILGVVAGIIIFFSFARTEVPLYDFSMLSDTVTDWTAIGIGIAIIAGCLFTHVILNIICFIVEYTFQTKENTEQICGELKKLRKDIKDMAVKND